MAIQYRIPLKKINWFLEAKTDKILSNDFCDLRGILYVDYLHEQHIYNSVQKVHSWRRLKLHNGPKKVPFGFEYSSSECNSSQK